MSFPPPGTSHDSLDEIRTTLASMSTEWHGPDSLPSHGHHQPSTDSNTERAKSSPRIHFDDSTFDATYKRTSSSSSTGSYTSPISPQGSAGSAQFTSLSAAALIGGGISGTDVHAKLLEFQNKRQSRSNSLTNFQKSGPLNKNSGALSDLSTESSNSSTSTVTEGALAFSAPVGKPIKRGPSLSERRGLKLDMSMASSPQDSPSSSSTSGTHTPVYTLPESSAPGSTNTTATSSSFSQTLGGTLSRANSSGSIKRANRPGQLPGRLTSVHEKMQPMIGRQGLFDNYKKYVDVKTGSLNFAGKASLHSKGVEFSSGTSFSISLDEFEPLGELGRGNYGTVTKVLHKPTKVIMAMKEIRLELDEQRFTQIIMELEVLHKCASPYIVDFYGAFFVEGAVYVCMEYMDGGSLDKIYKNGIAEPYLAFITEAAVRGLKQLKDKHNIIHRDVKPTNILVNTAGKVKLCDFGVSGNLVASIARTNIGCQSYMAPERIRSVNPNQAMTYTVESDVWSLGLSILETALGSYPYPPETYENIFSQLSAILDGDPPSLPADHFSPEARSFVEACLSKNVRGRPTYAQLLKHPWLEKWRGKDVHFKEFVEQAVAKRQMTTMNNNNNEEGNKRPALHAFRPTDLQKNSNDMR